MQLINSNLKEFFKNPLFFNLKLFFKPKREAYDKTVNISTITDPGFLERLEKDFEKGIKWCQDSSEHWAEVLTVKITEVNFNI